MDIINTIMRDNPLAALLHGHATRHAGYVFSMNFAKALVLTNDAWKEQVCGIPHNCFLVAAAFDPDHFAQSHDFDKEVVLLRVLGPASLPQDADMLKTRIEHNQRRTQDEVHAKDYFDGFDPLTQSELQYGGLDCRILGTFYMDGGSLRLGSDLENYMCSTRLRVFKPHKRALEHIINHINPEIVAKMQEEARKSGFSTVPHPIDIGTIRYTSTARLHRGKEELVPVRIQPSDFLARRTSVLGMTRTGKSNTIKTTVAAVALAARKDSLKVGQIIFDINGEYANANHQDDGSSIAEVFKADCVRYRAISTPGFEDLRMNFYEQPAIALSLLDGLTKDDPYRSSTDVDQFLSSSLEEPEQEDRSAYNRWAVRKAVFHCILSRAGFIVPTGQQVTFPASAKIVELVGEASGLEGLALQNNWLRMSFEDATQWFLAARDLHFEMKKDKKGGVGLPSSTSGKPWADASLEAYLNVLSQKNSGGTTIRGYRVLSKFIDYHSERRSGAVEEEILAHLRKGKIVILDLSAGPVDMRTKLSERIARKIFEHAFGLMNSGATPPHTVIYVEEAHNLIGKKDALDGTWPRIAKEGAKARIAFVYATQEPSSLHPNILANTENWFVTHLNNDDELRTLAKFYDFSDFVPSLKSAQDVGFARIKTLSSPFVVPTQIKKFEPALLKGDLEGAGHAL